MADDKVDSGTGAPRPTRGVLYDEHLALRAELGRSEENGLIYPSRYEGEAELSEALDGAVLADLTGATYRLISGERSRELCEAAFCARKLTVGECAFEPALAGDGAITSVPLLARTGDHEYVMLDPSERGPIAAGWLSFLSGVSQDGVTPFEGTEVLDANALLTPLLVVGTRAAELVNDYLPKGQGSLPSSGRLDSLMLDGRIPAIVAAAPTVPTDEEQLPAYLLFVQVSQARVVWRSLLSFPWVSPVGMDAVRRLWNERLPWAGPLAGSGTVEFGEQELRRWGLLRDEDDFVGARGL